MKIDVSGKSLLCSRICLSESKAYVIQKMKRYNTRALRYPCRRVESISTPMLFTSCKFLVIALYHQKSFTMAPKSHTINLRYSTDKVTQGRIAEYARLMLGQQHHWSGTTAPPPLDVYLPRLEDNARAANSTSTSSCSALVRNLTQ